MADSVLNRFSLEGKRALITGGAKGLGYEMALALAQAGAEVAIVSRTASDSEEAASRISVTTGRKAIWTTADIAKSEDVSNMADVVQAELGSIDILINNAGINIRGLVTEITEADFDSVVDISLKGAFLCSRRFGPQMAERGWGRIISMGSILSFVAMPGRAAYCSAKAGLLGLTRVLALEWAAQGVTVNAICPGPFATEMNQAILEDEEKYRAFLAKIPMGRWGDLAEITGPALFLASDAGSYVTGQSLVVDGGWTAW